MNAVRLVVRQMHQLVAKYQIKKTSSLLESCKFINNSIYSSVQ